MLQHTDEYLHQQVDEVVHDDPVKLEEVVEVEVGIEVS